MKFTEPEYYIDHVQVSTYDNDKIKEMMHSVDRSAMNQRLGDQRMKGIDDDMNSKESMTSVDVAQRNRELTK